MNSLEDYQKFVASLASPESTVDLKSKYITACMGLSGESGEFVDLFKKHIFHGKDLDLEHAKKELGDIMWYVAFACESLNTNIQEIIDLNVDKLKKRFQSGKFTTQEAINKSKDDV